MNVLVITKGAWRNDNNTGNTLNDIFSNWEGKVYSISCTAETPNDSICAKRFVLPEKDLINKLKNKNFQFGHEISLQHLKNEDKQDEEFYKYYRTHRSHFKYLARDMLWKISNWKSRALDDFLDSIEVDVIFMVGYGQSYLYAILEYVRKRLNKPVYISFMDDYYTCKQFSLSPFFWIRRFYMRKVIRKAIKKAAGLFAISPKQAEEYGRCFHRKLIILNKSAIFDELGIKERSISTDTLKVLYAGNIMCGRYKTLGLIGKAIEEINNGEEKIRLEIYSRNPINKKIRKRLHLSNNVVFGGGISAMEAEKKVEEADVVLHVESFELQERLDTRLSFSTKIVDYFKKRKCILAVGWEKAASMEYLKNENAAILVTNIKEVKACLEKLLSDREMILKYGLYAWECGCRNHQRALLSNRFMRALKEGR